MNWAKKIVPLALCAAILFSQHFLYGGPVRDIRLGVSYPTGSMMPSVLRSPLSLLFPFESFRHEVCRKPAFLFSTPLPNNNLSGYQFSGVLFKTNPIGTHYIRLNEQLTFRKGNSYFVLPHMSTLPADPGLNRVPLPTVNLPRPD